jgi:hypothetical protein
MELNAENLKKVEDYFRKYPAPNIPMKINVCSIVRNPPLMVETHIRTCKSYLNEHKAHRIANPYWERIKLVGKLTKKYYNKLNSK